MGSSPVVSVIMPAYNAERFIRQAINSVRAQTFEDWELIVVDDCSTDETASVAEGLAHEDNRISVVRNGHNSGVSRTRNRGIDLSKGEFIALLDSDDYWNPKKLDKQLGLIRKEQADIAYCSYAIVDERGNKKANDFIVPSVATFDGTLVQSVMSCSTVLIRRSSLGSQRFSSEVCHEDLALWLDLLRSGCKAVGNEEVLAAYRIVCGSRTSNRFMSAVHRWDLFRNHLHLPLGTCIGLISRYGWFAVRKYLPARDGGRP
jgi:teichuronic acid biosynthesis glycosyltransferase TuaG